MKEAQDEFKQKGGNKRLNLSMSSLWFDQYEGVHIFVTDLKILQPFPPNLSSLLIENMY